MRFVMIWMGVTATGLLRICGGDAPPVPLAPPTALPAPPVAAPPAPVAMPAPAPAPAPALDSVAVVPATTTPTVQPTLIARYGGNLLAVGSQGVELLPMTDGAVVAYVSDAAGNPLQGGAEMQVRLQGSDNTQHAVPLSWEMQETRYAGRLEGSVQPVAGPVEVSLTQSGQVQTGRLDLAAVVEPPQHGGVVMVVGAQKAEVLAKSDGVVKAYVTNSNGAVTDPSLRVVARVQSADRQTRELPLTYDAASGAYEAQAPADWTIAPGAVEVSVGSASGQQSVGRVETVALAPPASRGGAVVTAGGYGVEVLPRPDGQVEAYLCDAAATPIVADQGLQLSVGLAPGAQPVTLIWDPVQARFVGRVVGGARFNRGPVEVVVLSQGRRLRGRLAAWAAVPVRVAPVGPIPPPPVVRIPPPPVVRIPPPPVVRAPPPPPAVGVGVRVAPPPPPPAVGVGARGPGGRVEVEVRGPRGTVEVRPAKRPAKIDVNIRLGH